MRKFLKFIFLLTVMTFAILISNTVSEASSSDLYLNSLYFYATLNYDGSMDVTEIWNIDIEDTNTLYKTFKTDNSKYTGIENVTVTEITDGTERNLTKINELMYHVTNNCYYGMRNSDGNFEIAWGVGLDSGEDSRVYAISYTVIDAVSKHNDYAELYWQFVGEDFEVDAGKITGTIMLPENATAKEDIKVWGHTEGLNGEIYATDLNKIEFTINNFNSGRYVEIRTLFPTDMILYSGREDDENILDSVIGEETIWAEEANNRRRMHQATGIVIFIAAIGASIYSIIFAIGKYRKSKEQKKFTPDMELEYFRELPRENATPAQAISIIKELKAEFVGNDIGRIFSATLLNLNLKGILEFNLEQEKRKEKITIKILKNEVINLLPDEKIVFDFLVEATKSTGEITVDELKKYITSTASRNKIIKLQDNLSKVTVEELVNEGIYDKEAKKEYDKYATSMGLYMFAIIFLIMVAIILSSLLGILPAIGVIILIISLIISSIIIQKAMNSVNVYTQKGINEKERWKGLKKYMLDFSLLKEKDIPQIVIWEHFLVYATAFGIADKVLKQLKTVYPNIENEVNVNTYAYMYLMMNTNFSSSFSNAINNSMSSAYSSATGGGRRILRWRRRPDGRTADGGGGR